MRLLITPWKTIFESIFGKEARPCASRRLTFEALEKRQMMAGDTLSSAAHVSLSPSAKSEIEATIGSGEVKLYAVELQAGQTRAADIDAHKLDEGGSLSHLDARLRVFEELVQEVAHNDDAADPETGAASHDPALSFTAPVSGIYYVGVSEKGKSDYSPTEAHSGSGDSVGDYHLELS